MAAVPLPDGGEELGARLFAEDRVEVPIVPWPAPPRRLVRISMHVYNDLAEVRRLSEALAANLVLE